MAALGYPIQERVETKLEEHLEPDAAPEDSADVLGVLIVRE